MTGIIDALARDAEAESSEAPAETSSAPEDREGDDDRHRDEEGKGAKREDEREDVDAAVAETLTGIIDALARATPR